MFKHRTYKDEPTLAQHLFSLLPLTRDDEIWYPKRYEYDCPPLSYQWAVATPGALVDYFIRRTSLEATKGIAFAAPYILWPSHHQLLSERGFHLRRVHSFFLEEPHTFNVFQKAPGGIIQSWDVQPWEGEHYGR